MADGGQPEEFEPITNPVLMQTKTSRRDPKVDLAKGAPKRDRWGQAI